MKKTVSLLLISIVTVLVLFSCKKESEAVSVTAVLDWTVNTNHTGLYVADKLGYFADEGLDVDIQFPPETGADAMVASGKAEFCYSYQESVTFSRAADVPLVAVAAVIQHNTSGFASRAGSGIKTPADFEGKRYGGWGSPIEEATLKALMQADGADYSELENLSIGSMDFFAATEKSVDFTWIFYGWDGIASDLKDIDINYIPLNEYEDALDYYTPVISTSEMLISENPDTVKKFLKALSKGYLYSIENPGKAADILLEAAPELDSDLVHASQKYLADEYMKDADRWGEMELSTWENYTNWLFERDLLGKDIDNSKAFTNEFLPE